MVNLNRSRADDRRLRRPVRLRATVTREDGETFCLVLREFVPGRYEVRRVLQPGLYEIEFAADSGAGVPGRVQDCFVVLPGPGV